MHPPDPPVPANENLVHPSVPATRPEAPTDPDRHRDARDRDAHVWSEAQIDAALDESFPASDPPSWTPGRV